MKLDIHSIADAGNLEKERLVLKALLDADVGDYAVLWSRTGTSGGPTSGRKTAYWFPDAGVKAGDSVVLYTKKGDRSKKPLSEGRTAHFFYWGSDAPLWDEEHCAVLLFVSDWDWRRGRPIS